MNLFLKSLMRFVGINRGIESVGGGISAYGAGMINATAPNASSGMKRIAPESRPGGPIKAGTTKALPSTAAHTQRALPAPKSVKALPAPPAKRDTTAAKKELPKVKPQYQPPSSTYTPSKQGGYTPPKSAAGVGKKKDEPVIKSRALSSGKVVASRASLPQHVGGGVPSGPAKAPSSAKGPSSVKAPSLSLPPAAGSPKPYTANGGFKAPSKAGSVVGTAPKNFGGHIPGFATGSGGSKPASKAPTVVGIGNKTAAKPPPSKAGSVVDYKGGPKFF